jgi:hypothetical protein
MQGCVVQLACRVQQAVQEGPAPADIVSGLGCELAAAAAEPELRHRGQSCCTAVIPVTFKWGVLWVSVLGGWVTKMNFSQHV